MPRSERLLRPGFLHPAGIIAAAGGGTAAGRVRRWVVRHLYEHLAWAYPMQDWTTMNYGYAHLPGETPLTVVPSDGAAERNGLQLYARVASSGRYGADLGGLDVLEVGSGRGGGAAFVADSMGPRRVTGLDVAAAALATARHGGLPNLEFTAGDAEGLALPDASFDIVLRAFSG